MATRLAGPDGGPLIKWYRANGRDLPWRRTKDPYAVWVSEIMLQQTQVATVLPYYARWMDALPTVTDLAGADEERVLSLWQGLGYYRRCRLLQKGAQYVVESGMPSTFEGWLAVPGVGKYTAAAISSICFGVHAAVVDGNVERVYARLAADESTGSTLLRNAQAWADKQLWVGDPGDWNQAVMELGATVCTPRTPKCETCPVSEFCVARQTWRVDQFPVSPPKKPWVRMARQVVLPWNGTQFGVQRIPEGQWWQGMWSFLSIEGPEPPAIECDWLESLGELAHTVTHHKVALDLWLARGYRGDAALTWMSPDQLRDAPLPAPYRRALKIALETLGLAKASG